ncbi:rhomboid family intramembrane serine protease [Ignavibacteria bacterium]|nr:rhomboid family intramembrane serine protease [Bacteroidota bacterium]MCZ2133045.1 rhomboid family intramembrane serine protease [Bacteroidota bacterium]
MSYSDRDYNFRQPQRNKFSLFPPVIKALLISNVVIFLFSAFFIGSLSWHGQKLSYLFEKIFALQPVFGVEDTAFYPWQIVTYLFLHAGFSHIFFNMLALWMFGVELETLWGSRRFLIFYLLCGVGAGVIQLLTPLLPDMAAAPTVGASGAVFGILLAFGLTFPDRPIIMFPLFFPVPAKIFVIVYAAIDLISGLIDTNSGVAHFAHLGGAFVGYMLLKHGDDLRIFAAFDRLFALFERRNIRIQPKRRRNTAGRRGTGLYYGGHEITEDEVNNILDKISATGFSSLSDEEKRILYEVSKKKE